jgi:hypothetical protein
MRSWSMVIVAEVVLAIVFIAAIVYDIQGLREPAASVPVLGPTQTHGLRLFVGVLGSQVVQCALAVAAAAYLI